MLGNTRPARLERATHSLEGYISFFLDFSPLYFLLYIRHFLLIIFIVFCFLLLDKGTIEVQLIFISISESSQVLIEKGANSGANMFYVFQKTAEVYTVLDKALKRKIILYVCSSLIGILLTIQYVFY